MRLNISVAALIESQRLGRIERSLHACGLAMLNGINTREMQPPTFGSLFSCFRESNYLNGAKPHLPFAPTACVSENPRLPQLAVSATCALEVQAAAIGPHACLGVLHLH